MNTQYSDYFRPLSKELFFNEVSAQSLLSKEEEEELFKRYNLVLSSWIAKLLMIAEVVPKLIEEFELKDAKVLKNDLIKTIRWSYPCVKRLNSLQESLIDKGIQNENIVADLVESKRSIQLDTEKIVNANIGMVVKVAKQYNFLKLPLMDLIQEGFIGLLTAIEKFDLKKGNRFSTYAWWWIKQSIVSYSRKQGGIVRRPESLVDLIIKLSPHISNYKSSIDNLTLELSEEFDIDEERIREAIFSKHTDLSIDFLSNESATQTNWEDKHLQFIPSQPIATPKQISKLLNNLPKRLKLVLLLRFGFHAKGSLTRRQIGEVLGIGSERVRQLEVKGLSFLRDEMRP